MAFTRRETIKVLGATVAVAAVGDLTVFAASAKPKTRMALDKFLKDPKLLAALRKGVREMKKRKPSDPLSWWFQAAIHGVPKEMIAEWMKTDPDVAKVDQARFWNQCPHHGENSANFLPWHRGYTYYFEQILRMHTGDATFSLPYWNYHPKKNRQFPREFGIEHLDGNLENNADENINPLFHPARDFYFTSYEHPFAKGLPLLTLTDSAVDVSLPMKTPVFFGETERQGLAGGIADNDASTRGLLESYPHDHIHRAVGGIVTSANPAESGCDAALGAMATPPTAGFDPIFCVHHANVDRLWAKWSCMHGKGWGKLPPKSWFDEKPWFFFDTSGKVVNEPRQAYFDYRALGIRFDDEDLKCKPLALPAMKSMVAAAQEQVTVESLVRRFRVMTRVATGINVPAVPRAAVSIPIGDRVELRPALERLKTQGLSLAREDRIFIQLENVRMGAIQGMGFDVHVSSHPDAPLTRESSSFVGSIALFRHPMPAENHSDHSGSGMTDSMTETFDISHVMRIVDPSRRNLLNIVLVPYPLLEVAQPGARTVFINTQTLHVGAINFARLE